MINICFSSSAAAMLHILSLDNKIIYLNDDLSIGNINNLDASSRVDQMIYYASYNIKNYHDHNEGRKSEISIYDNFYKDIQCIPSHEEILIWYSNSPFEYCGMLYTLWLLKEREVNINLLNVSQYGYSFVVEIGFEGVQTLLSLGERITLEEKIEYCKKWELLQSESGELRMYIDNTIRTVPDEFFDEVLVSFAKEKSIDILEALTHVCQYYREEKKIIINYYYLFSRLNILLKTGVLK
ncbi:DUF1835 domain-containing protein [Tissierellaceae bacterium HCP3S3_D8]